MNKIHAIGVFLSLIGIAVFLYFNDKDAINYNREQIFNGIVMKKELDGKIIGPNIIVNNTPYEIHDPDFFDFVEINDYVIKYKDSLKYILIRNSDTFFFPIKTGTFYPLRIYN